MEINDSSRDLDLINVVEVINTRSTFNIIKKEMTIDFPQSIFLKFVLRLNT